MAKQRIPDVRRHLPGTAFILLLLLVAAGFVGAFIYAGIYNIGADAPHSRLTYLMLDQLRERAISHHSRNVATPADLDSAKRIAMGAGLYSEMCTGCHLGPGVEKSEMSQGLYPPAPELAQVMDHSPAQQFWIIKHGIKLSAMPAWGKTHDDQLIWDMVAFVRTLPKLSPAQYQAAVASAPADHDEMMKGRDAKSGARGAHQAAHESKPHIHPPGHEHH